MIPDLQIELPKSLSSIVEERIRNAIINAELSFGQALPEDGVGLALGVSRTPMREALTRLQLQGLVVIVPKKGTFVFQPTLADVEQLASFRLILEVAALRLCLAHAAAPTRQAMSTALDAMTRARRDEDGKAYAGADTQFHGAFFTHCGNSYLANAYHTISGRVAALRAQLSISHSNQQAASFTEHEQMIECFARGQMAPLNKLLKQHILRASSAYADALREMGLAQG